MDNSEKLISKIKEDNVRPLPKWRFTLKDTSTWILFALTVAFGALAFSVILFAIQQVDFNLVAHMSHSFFEMVLVLVPFVWIVVLVLFLVAAVISIRNSKKGYKFSSLSLIGICAALSILLGTFFFIAGGGKWLENAFATNVSYYESVQDRKAKLWTMPEEGYLSGKILKVSGDSMVLEDFSGNRWVIDINDVDIVPSIRLEQGELIKIIGEMTSATTFSAKKVRPWGSGERMKRKKRAK